MPTTPTDANGFALVHAPFVIPFGCFDELTSINTFGLNTDITLDTEEEIWDGQAPYVFPTIADMTKISQTTDQVAMRGGTIKVIGLDINFELVSQFVDLDATDTTIPVTLATPLLRFQEMCVNENVLADQPIRLHNDAETIDFGIIIAGNNRTFNGIYTVPAGRTVYMTRYWAHHNPATGKDPTSLPIKLYAKSNVPMFERRLRHVVGLAIGGGFQHEFDPYLEFTEKTDIFLTGTPVGKNADVSAGFDFIIANNRI